jgi:protein gp37
MGVRQRVFCASLADWLDDDGVSVELTTDLLALIYECQNLDWLLLTKRPEKWQQRLTDCVFNRNVSRFSDWIVCWLKGKAPTNVWVGTSVGHQKSADTRIPELLKIPARVRFLSCEPMLGPVDLTRVEFGAQTRQSVLTPTYMGQPFSHDAKIDWVICGGESGPGARPMHPDWARSLRDQCAAVHVPFLFKQWGEWYPCESDGETVSIAITQAKGQLHVSSPKKPEWHTFPDGQLAGRIGKHAAGRFLDGVEHNGSPETRT